MMKIQCIFIFTAVWFIHVSCSIFYPVHTINLHIPISFPPNIPLISLPAYHHPNTLSALIYNFTGSPYIQTSSSSLSLTNPIPNSAPTDLEDAYNLYGWLEVQDSFGNYNRTQIRVERVNKGCGDLVEEMCFIDGKFTIPENYPRVEIGPLGLKSMRDFCKGYEISYKLLNHTTSFAIINNSLHTLGPLDRDLNWLASPKTWGYSYRNLEILCNVDSPDGGHIEFIKTVRIDLIDINDHGPMLQEKDHIFVRADNIFEINKTLTSQTYIFRDWDSLSVNNLTVEVLGDDLQVISHSYILYEDDRDGQHQSVLALKLWVHSDAIIPQDEYNVIIVVNDTSLEKKYGQNTANLTITFLPSTKFSTSVMAENYRINILYPSSKVTLLRTAALLARVSQPKNNINVTQCRFALNDHYQAFNVTVKGGIVYVKNVTALRNLQKHIQLEIKWRNKTSNEYFSDYLAISLETESGPQCLNFTENSTWGHCAGQATKKSCEKTCGLGSGSHADFIISGHTKCMWKAGIPSIHPIKYYSTCTSERTTCPDYKCDELEELHHWLCPQDCTESVSFPNEINQQTKRGVYKGIGVCKCDKKDMCYCSTPKETIKTTIVTITTTEENENQPNISARTDDNSPLKAFPIPSCDLSCLLSIAVACIFLLSTASFLAACWRRRRLQESRRDRKLAAVAMHTYTQDGQNPQREHQEETVANFGWITEDRGEVYVPPKLLPVVDTKWEFPREKLRMEQTLGEGEFGRVLRAKALEIANIPGYTTVAVKTLKEGARESELTDLMSEYQLLKDVSHPNVIKLLGACTLPGGPVYLIIEFAEFGSLRNYLRRSRHLESDGQIPNSAALMMGENQTSTIPNHQITPKNILSFAWQISKGMNYLNDMKLVHRDLAARNILLAEDMVCKISDFGLTRDVYEDDTYLKRTKGRVPVKWMAPESLADHIYNSKSDVWSFGILIWELVTLGASPYPGIAVQNLFHLLKSGYRMERPENCSIVLYKIMNLCWSDDPSERPSFKSLMIKLEAMLADGTEYLDLNPRTVHNRTYLSLNNTTTIEGPEYKLNLLSGDEKSTDVNKLQPLWERPESPISPRYQNQGPEGHHYESPIKRVTEEKPTSYIDMEGQKLLNDK